jgi:hypothetical protein
MGTSDIIRDFQEADIDKVWQELKKLFGFDLRAWKKEFREFLYSQPRNTTAAEAFIIFGNRHINPVLNEILRRNELFPTFNKLVEYILNRNKPN